MKKLSRRSFIKTGISGATLIMCGGLLSSSKWILHPIEAAPGFQTTIKRTVIPVPVPVDSPKLHATDISQYKQYVYGIWQEGAGVRIEKRLDLMPSTYTDHLVKKRAKLLRFFP